MNARSFQLAEHFLSLDGHGRVSHHDGGAKFWADMSAQTDMLATLVSYGSSEKDWPHWEMHPKGDEVLFLVEGETTFILEKPEGGDERVTLKAGDSFVIPAGVWHRAFVHKPSKTLFITYGEGASHKPVAA
jgi:mannose-6-phosphate isomerase-like protein (cupin superfamily)